MGVNQSSLARKREMLYHGGMSGNDDIVMNEERATITTSNKLNTTTTSQQSETSSLSRHKKRTNQESAKNRASVGLLLHSNNTNNSSNGEKKRFTISLFTRTSSSSKSPPTTTSSEAQFYYREEDHHHDRIQSSGQHSRRDRVVDRRPPPMSMKITIDNHDSSSATATSRRHSTNAMTILHQQQPLGNIPKGSKSEPSSPNKQKNNNNKHRPQSQHHHHHSPIISPSFSAASSGSSSGSGSTQPGLLMIPNNASSSQTTHLDGKIKSLSPSVHRPGYLSGLLALKRRSKRSSSQPSNNTETNGVRTTTTTTTTTTATTTTSSLSSSFSSPSLYQTGLTDEESTTTLFSTLYPSINAQQVIQLLRDPIGLELFYEFCSKQMCSENIELFKELEWLEHKIPNLSSTSRVKHIKSIHEKFLSMDSELEVNVSHHARQLVEKERHSKKIDVESTLTLVDFLKRDVCTNLFDAFSRFIQTKEYIQWREVKYLKYNSAPRSQHDRTDLGKTRLSSGNVLDEQRLERDPARISTSSCDGYSFGSSSLISNSVPDLQLANLTPPTLENEFTQPEEHSDNTTLFTSTM
ncbi:hypothetical protein C9374_010227 [Naegleria lovaniensis]|uniref:RGS domain-containing protein n=1 Tax=Naegleria lovaniensis TaxID=51637 RepID=A0AA88KEA7_NAELO|nr:uncharacterized protein C9374_010227 [Naegleria lovaniensis]KAG2374853.1 hypothetical protein C9374_010227 [Naegleria lovaniensis]